MPDLDELLTSDIAQAAADAARRPSVGALASRGARHRRARRGSALFGAVAAVAAITLGVNQLNRPAGTTTPAPAPSTSVTHQGIPTPSASPRDATATTILSSPGSRIWSLTVAPGNPRHRLSEWYGCLDPGACQSHQYALAVTGDGFASRHVLDLPATTNFAYEVEPAGSDHFIVSDNGHLVGVVDLSGRVRRITVAGRARPATDGEVVSTDGTKKPIAVDPLTGAAHPLALPPGTQYLEDVSDRLWASGTSHLAWSDDGGVRWNPVVVPANLARKPYRPIPTADSRIVGLIIGGSQVNNTLPWLDTLRGVAGSALTSSPPPAAAIDPTAVAVLPDGRLLALITSWNSWPSGRHSPRAGFYVGQDWSHLAPVRMGAPFDKLSYTDVPTVLNVTTYGGTVTIYAVAPGQSGVVSSTDGGATWHPEVAR